MNPWTEKDIPNLDGKVFVITGANNGLGYESARLLAEKHAEVIMAVRSMEKGIEAVKQLQQQVPDAKVKVMNLDLADLSSVQTFVETFTSTCDHLDVLMNNAGVMMTPQRKTQDGFELQLGTNHLGHFALTGQLLPTLLKTPGSRVVNVSSLAAENGEIHFDDLMLERDYSRGGAYGQSKLANLLFTLGLQQRFEEADVSSISVAAHPGVANTNLVSGMMNNRLVLGLIRLVSSFIVQKADEGALPQLHASVASTVQGGDYYGPSEGMKGDTTKIPMPPSVHDEDVDKLWQVSEELTKVRYDFGVQAIV